MKRKKTVFNEFEQFFENPTHQTFKMFLGHHLGETPHVDFKEEWISIIRHVLGIANSGGGCLIFGVSERSSVLTPTGLSKLRPKKEITDELKGAVPDSLLQKVEPLDFCFKSGKLAKKVFQVVIIGSVQNELPYVVERDKGDVKSGQIFIRRGTSSELANHSEVQRLIAQRLLNKPDRSRLQTMLANLNDLRGALVDAEMFDRTASVFVNRGFSRLAATSFLLSQIEKQERAIADWINQFTPSP